MLDVLHAFLRSVLTVLRGNRNLALENLTLRHRLMVVQRQLKRARLSNADHALLDAATQRMARLGQGGDVPPE